MTLRKQDPMVWVWLRAKMTGAAVYTLAAALLIFLAAAGPLAGTCSAQTLPYLQIDTGGHTDTVKALAFSADDKFLVSAGNDKVIRVWATATGKLLRSISGAIGPGKEGEVFALALSPDGKWLAAGGWFDKDDAAQPCCGDIRLFDFETGQLRTLLKAHTNAVYALSFSNDGRSLASGGADRTAIIWDVSRGLATARMETVQKPRERITAVSFVGNDKVVVGSNDGSLRLWNFKTNKLGVPVMQRASRISGVAVDTTRSVAFAGYFDGSIAVWDLKTGLEQGNWTQSHAVGSLTLTRDHQALITTCGKDCGSAPEQIVWDSQSGAKLTTYRGHRSIVEAIATSTNSFLAATAGGTENEIHLWDVRTGTQKFELRGQGKTIWSVGISRDSTRVSWGYTSPCAHESYCPSITGPLELSYELPTEHSTLREPMPIAKGTDFDAAVTRFDNLSLSPRDGPAPQRHRAAILDLKRGNEVIRSIERTAGDGFVHSAYSFTADGEAVISGGQNGILIAYYSDSGQDFEEFVGSSGAILSVVASPNGKLLVSGGTDQTLHIWNLQTAELIASLFLATDGNWIIWTPQGFYDCSRDADKYVGWFVNQGADKNSRYITARELKRHFYRWDIVENALLLGSAEEAIRRANRAEFDIEQLLAKQPPEFSIVSPQDHDVLTNATATIVLNISSTREETIGVEVRIGDVPVAIETRGAQAVDTNNMIPSGPVIKLEVPLDVGLNDISVFVTNQIGTSERSLSLNRTGPDESARRGSLNIIAIGINDYGDEAGVRNLKYANADAEVLSNILTQLGPYSYTGVQLTLLTSGTESEPTASNIRAALAQLTEAQANDTSVIFIAGHGTRGDNDDYFVLPSDARWQDGSWYPSSVVSWGEVERTLADTKGHRLVLLDTCRAANAYNKRLMKDAFDASIVVFGATNAKTLAQEIGALKHGLFSYALIEAFRGMADKLPQDGHLSVNELAAYVIDRVAGLSKNRQIPEFDARQLSDLRFVVK